MKKIFAKFQYNSPVILTMTLISAIALLLNFITRGWTNLHIFSVYASGWTNPMTYVRMFTHVLGHADYSHFLGNYMMILLAGPMMEEKYGSAALVKVIVITALITAVMVKEDSSVRILSKRYANTMESHAYLTIAMGREKDQFRIGLAIKGCGIFLPDIMNWGVSWKKAGVRDDMFGTEEYKRYLAGVTLDQMYEKLGGEGGSEL